ncbi:hypothetical protein SAMN02745225_00168 [Ferrithrix thermotolerans DSM 19514]|jgi:hypothetical protein|uniref:Uncharacterized protein n=1 Tax=Ferrithrix thermotolerans DSM 19514 TaxID=1121881 RepID=A0A1M4SAI3_9ACTN|nr:hypothetical protein SAMN02745225_00168 [Ferrithrix thermotolerans DSM 19514]
MDHLLYCAFVSGLGGRALDDPFEVNFELLQGFANLYSSIELDGLEMNLILPFSTTTE